MHHHPSSCKISRGSKQTPGHTEILSLQCRIPITLLDALASLHTYCDPSLRLTAEATRTMMNRITYPSRSGAFIGNHIFLLLLFKVLFFRPHWVSAAACGILDSPCGMRNLQWRYGNSALFVVCGSRLSDSASQQAPK